MDVVPLKVKIGLEGKFAKYPNFNMLPVVQASGMDWAEYIDAYGSGWLYDKDSGHKNARSNATEWDSPRGQQWGVILVPEKFADEAIANYPDDCTEIDEAQLETFYDTCHSVQMNDVRVDEDALKEFSAKEEIGALSAEDQARKAKAIDPDDPTPGLRKNPHKKWATHKARRGYNVIVSKRALDAGKVG